MSFDENISADRRVARNFDTGAISRNGTVRRRRFGAAISAMECETYFPLECHQSAKGGVINILANHCGEERLNCNCSDSFAS